MDEFIWQGEVRANELDPQGIVNNAHYLCYFDHVRTLQMKALEMDWVELSRKGFNLVRVHADIRFINSLRAFERFEVHSTFAQEGRLKLIFEQTIYCEGRLICEAKNTIACVNTMLNKPVALKDVIILR